MSAFDFEKQAREYNEKILVEIFAADSKKTINQNNQIVNNEKIIFVNEKACLNFNGIKRFF